MSADGGCWVDISICNVSGSDLTVWSNENWDGIASQLNPNHKSDDEESENEDIRDNTELINLKDALPSITTHRAQVSELCNTTLMILLANMEKEYEKRMW